MASRPLVNTGEKSLVFHVGAAPTASWRLQRCLVRNGESLRAGGLQYVANDVLAGGIGALIEDPEPLASVLDQALHAPELEVLVASQEGTLGHPFDRSGGDGGGLFADAGPALDALAELTRSYRRTIVLSVCPQPEFLESYFRRMINAGDWAAFDAWLDGVDLDELSWLPVHEKLVGAFGADDVRVIDYRDIEQDEAGFLRNFFALVGRDLPITAVDLPESRPGLSAKGLRVALAGAPYLTGSGQRGRLHEFVLRNFSELDYPRPSLLSGERRAALKDRYGDEYERLVAHGATTDGA
ncbi:MAG: hypothetical protein ACRDWT_18675 [Jatrophihabitantaceae bacterium]